MPAAWGFSDDSERTRPGRVARLVPAAVLITLVNRRCRPTVLFIERTAHLRHHAGQIGFPGGRVERRDKDAAHTALRETEEELGLAAARIEILGRIPAYTTGTGFRITPVVGWTEPPLALSPNRFEVTEIFEVPFPFVMNPVNHRIETALFHGRRRTNYAIRFQGRHIWGATAGMLVSLSRQLAVLRR